MAFIVKPTNLVATWASTGVKVEPAASKISAGWVVETPPYQFDNWLNNRQDTFNAHVNQAGIPHWDATTEYIGNKSYCQDSDGIVYKALVTNINVVPSNPLNVTKWVRAFEPFGSVAVVTSALNTHVTNYGTLNNLVNPVTARANLSVFSKAEADARFAALAGTAAQTFHVANATAPTHAITKAQLDVVGQQATESIIGVNRIASQTTMNVGTNDTDTVTALKATATFARRDKNLSDLASPSVARNNLGLTVTATTSLAEIHLKDDNLAGVASPAAARTNLGLGDMALATQSSFLRKDGNLSGIVNVPVARDNLGLGTLAVENVGSWLSKAGNLAGLTDVAVSRGNLGLGTIATRASGDFLDKAGNLAGLTNPQSARNNLGLGGLATFSPQGVDAPGIAGSYLDFSALVGANGFMHFPNGILVQWGERAISDIAYVTDFAIPYTKPFTTVFQTLANAAGAQSVNVNTIHVNNNYFVARCWERDGTYTGGHIRWIAIGM